MLECHHRHLQANLLFRLLWRKLVGNAIDGNTGERLDIADKIAEVVGITGGCSTVNDDFKLVARRRIEGLVCWRGRSDEEPLENLVSGKERY